MKLRFWKKQGASHKHKFFSRSKPGQVASQVAATLPADGNDSSRDNSRDNEQQRLEDIATLAKRHSNPVGAGGGYRLRSHLGKLEKHFEKIYRHLAARVESGEKSTRSEEWLLDNRHVVQEALQLVCESLPRNYLKQLPQVTAEDGSIDLRLHLLANALITDFSQPVDVQSIHLLVDHYQEDAVLTTGELWALPALLRLCLLEHLAQLAEEALGGNTGTEEELSVGIASGIISLRELRSCNWRDFVESLSRLERILHSDPADAYRRMDFETRDRYRDVIEKLARGSGASEQQVAQQLVKLSSEQEPGSRTQHVGYYLIDEGRPQLEAILDYRPGFLQRIHWRLLHKASKVFFSGLALFSIPLLLALAIYLLWGGASVILTLLVLVVAAVPLIGMALALVNGLITHCLPPRLLAKMDFDKGISKECRTVVVMPVLFADAEDMQRILECLEINFLNNGDENLVYAVLSDFADSDEQSAKGDNELLEIARASIESLNERHRANEGRSPFLLLHRERRWNSLENCWMGWERKRGKLIEFNHLLSGREDHSFTSCFGDREQLQGIRYVITLDADSQMPPDTARRLVGAMAHPLNRAVVNDDLQRVVAGYGFLQPRVETDPASSDGTIFSQIFSGDRTVDLYTHAVSDAYQDLFGEAIFTGKGIYDPEVFSQTLVGHLPENAILSHDLLEGAIGGVGLLSDAVFYEQYPPNIFAMLRRSHRWIRGDWQLLSWLGKCVPIENGEKVSNPLPPIQRWQIADNLRRSLESPSLLALFLLAWSGWLPGQSWAWTLLLLLLSSASVWQELLSMIWRSIADPSRAHLHLRGGPAVLQQRFLHWLLSLALLPVQAVNALDAIVRTLYRLRVSHRHLLQWTSAAHVNRSVRNALTTTGSWREMWVSPAIALLVTAGLIFWAPASLLPAAPFLLAWLFAPQLVHHINLPRLLEPSVLSEEDKRELRLLSRRTWFFFEHFMGPDDHWLPPDNYQEEPLAVLARRTSPTNIGLGLLSILSAYDFGYVDLSLLLARLNNSFDRMRGLERYRGHFLNWYETRELHPLNPRYVSTVDSGNLAGSLLTLASGLEALKTEPLSGRQLVLGITDTLDAMAETLQPVDSDSTHNEIREINAQIAQFRQRLQAGAEHNRWWQTIDDIYERDVPWLQERMLTLIEGDEKNFSAEDLGRLRQWLDELHRHAVAARRYQEALEPWLRLMQAPPKVCREGGGPIKEGFHALAAALNNPVSLSSMPSFCEAAKDQLQQLQKHIPSESLQQRDEVTAWCEKLYNALERARENAASYCRDITNLATRARNWVEEMDFAFLYDRDQHLFHIGYNVTDAALDANHYDLLASESRLTGFLAIAKGDVPARHWRHLERPFRHLHRRVVLMSWSATLFEYLMPRLFMETPEHSLIGRACRNAIEVHRKFTGRYELPWGIAESGYYELDSQLHYQYRAFGVPGIGFRRDLGERLVIAPYASMMALPFDAGAVMENLRQLRAEGGYGQFGLYEAIDYGRTAKPIPRRARTVRSYMSHHQGMILLSINNYLHEDIMQQRFHSDVRIAGLTPLLHERLPTARPALRPWQQPGLQRSFHAEGALQSWSALPGRPYPQYNVLSNGHHTLLLGADGAGGSYWHNIALTRWQPDPTRHQGGHWNYIRDLDSGELFSVGLAPCGGDAGHCMANFSPQGAEFQRREAELFCRLHIALSSQHDLEARRLVIKNESNRSRHLLLADYTEVVLAPERDYQRHPAFAKLFVESQYLPEEQVMLYRRRPRSSDEKPIYMAHCVLVSSGVNHQLAWETDRMLFLGRGGSPARPLALQKGLAGFTGTTGPVLDPVIASAQEISIPPQSEVEVIYLTGASKSRRELLSVLRSYRSRPKARWVYDLARMQSEQELHNLRIPAADVYWMMDLLTAVLAPSGGLRAPSRVLARSHHIQRCLWSRGISGDNPILLVQVRSEQGIDFAEPILQAHTLWSGRGLAIDLVIVDEDSAGYSQQTRDRLQEMIADIRGRTLRKLNGSVVIVPGQELPESDRIGLLAAARVLLDSSAGSVATQLESSATTLQAQMQPLPPFVPVQPAGYTELPTTELQRPDDLLFDNGLGGFSADGREYILHLKSGKLEEPGERPPAPWVNVIANPDFGCLVSEGGSCCTWSGNSGEHRLTAWNNDPVRDPSGEMLYLRDEESAEVWCPTPAPRPAEASYQVHHGAGYTEYRHNSHGLEQSWRITVDRSALVKIGRLTLKNGWNRPRRLTATYYVEWVLGLTRSNWTHLINEFVPESHTLLARNAFVPDAKPGVAFLTASLPPHGLTTDRHEFLGSAGGPQAPEALFRIGLSGRVQSGGDPCAAYQVHIDLAIGETQHIYFVMGEGIDRAQALDLAGEFRDPQRAANSQAEFEQFWEDYLGSVQVQVPDKATELMVNRWLPYQTLACRLWGRSGFYQSSGAFGFRDQLQDVQALLWTHPDWTRQHILRTASRQFQDGDVLHWWHENPLRGVRTRCSDDLLWLPFVTAQYIRTTGDYEILNEPVSYLAGAPLGKDEHERYAEFESSDESGSLYEHCCRAIERAGAVGPHGLPVIGNGDWNDGFSRISTTGRGESVWMGWFLLRVCRDMAPLCDYIGDSALAEHYRLLGENFRQQVEDSGWDGAWYRRAYYDDGTPIGSKESDECKIDLIAQTWSVLSQEEPTERAHKAMESANRHLVNELARQILLLKPPFNKTKKDPGYIKGYPPGIRENGGQYTHAATWAVWAAAGLNQSERAWHYFNLLNPVTHTNTAEGVQRYRTEPYVLAGDVYGVPPHVGRGGWTWYSGASGWLYRSALEALLGAKVLDGDHLVIEPCLPQTWHNYHLSLRFGSSRYEIAVSNCGGCPREIESLTLDGEHISSGKIPLKDDGQEHKVSLMFKTTSPAPG